MPINYMINDYQYDYKSIDLIDLEMFENGIKTV